MQRLRITHVLVLAMTLVVWTLLVTAVTATPSIEPTAYDIGGAVTQARSSFDCSTTTGLPQAECEALVAIYNASGGDTWIDLYFCGFYFKH